MKRKLLKKGSVLFALTMFFVMTQAMNAQDGSTCDEPLVITSMPYTHSGNTSDYGDNYDGDDVPPLAPGAITEGTSSYGFYLTGDDVVYSYTAGANGNITINTTNDDDWVGLFAFTGCPFESTVGYHTSTSGTSRSIPDLPVLAGETYYIVISTWAAPQSTDYTINITGTDVGDGPSCLKPTNLMVDNTTETTADISWVAGDEETAWNISWGTPDYSPGDDDEINTANSDTANFQITDLTAETHYDIYVQADCGEGDESLWTGPLVVYTGYCIPTGSSNNSDEIRNFTLSNLNNDSEASEGTDGYSNYSSSVSPAELEAGESYVASLTSGPGTGNHGAAIWIDYDNNGVFESSEMVSFISSSITASSTVDFPEFTVPDSISEGTYRLRIQYHYNKDGDLLDPCAASSSYSETEDYSVSVIGEEIETEYCTPFLDCEDGDMITNVTFLEIDNTTTCSADGYGDYTSMTATVEAGGTYPISVSVGDGWINESVSVWIDFDNSGTFDEDEFFYIDTGSNEALTGDISIPITANNGDYRMRVRVAAVGMDTATWDMSCDETQGFGETEDYTITVDGIMGVDDNVITNFTYFPNPMEDVLNITADLDIKSVAVFNVLGQEILGNKHFNGNKVDVSTLPRGTFIFRVTFDNGSIKNFKAVKK